MDAIQISEVVMANDVAVAEYGPLVVLIVIVIFFAVSMLALTSLFGPNRKGKVKGSVYESGMNPIISARKRFNVRFYILAIAYLVFAVEIVFLYPWASVLPNLEPKSDIGLQFVFRMVFFVGTSIIAYVYAWRKGVFRYD